MADTYKNDINTSSSSTIANKAKKVAHDISETANFDRRELKLIAADAGKKVADFFHEKSEQAHDIRVNTENRVKENPIKSVAIAAVGGLLLGAILGRK